MTDLSDPANGLVIAPQVSIDRVWLMIACCSLAFGCSDADDLESRLEQSPSLEQSQSLDLLPSVEIIEDNGETLILNRLPEFPEGTWSIGAEPTLRIGESDGDARSLFERIPYSYSLPDGRVVVVNSGSAPVIRLFSPDGNFLSSAGSRGEGPGEFSGRPGLAVQRVAFDTLVLYDSRYRRYTSTATDGTFVRSWTARESWIGWVQDLPGDAALWIQPTDVNQLPPGVTPLRTKLILGTDLGPGSDTLTVLNTGVIVAVTTEGGRFPYFPPYSEYSQFAYNWASGSIIATGQTNDLWILPLQGGNRVHVTMDLPAKAFNASDWNWSEMGMGSIRVAAMDSTCGYCMRARKEAFELLEFPEHVQWFDAIRTDEVGGFWVRLSLPPRELETAESREWWAFSREGRWLANVPLPAQLLPLEIGDSHLLGLWVNDLGVHSVRRYELVKQRIQ